jgi:hypothetical protein
MFYVQFQSKMGQMRSVIIIVTLMLTAGGIFDILFGTKLIADHASARPLSLMVSEVSAPYPNHCLDQRQWLNPKEFTPYNLFDSNPSHVWQLCDYAMKDQGYTVNFKLGQAIEIDGFVLTQVLKQISSDTSSKTKRTATQTRKAQRRKRDKRDRRTLGESLKRFKRMQIIFYNSEISPRYPVYFQEIKFDGSDRVALEYREIMAWNPILIGDPQFDERRRSLGLAPSGMTPPIKVDKIGLVFWEYEGEGDPPALGELILMLKGERYQLNQLDDFKVSYGQSIGKTYDLLTRDYLFVGDDRALIFSRSGTLWGMEGEEEVAKVMGAWRFSGDRIEVDLSPRQQARISGKRRKSIEKSRKNKYQPLRLIVDESPSRVYIVDGPLAGEYETLRTPVPTEVLDEGQDETPPPFEAP